MDFKTKDWGNSDFEMEWWEIIGRNNTLLCLGRYPDYAEAKRHFDTLSETEKKSWIKVKVKVIETK